MLRLSGFRMFDFGQDHRTKARDKSILTDEPGRDLLDKSRNCGFRTVRVPPFEGTCEAGCIHSLMLRNKLRRALRSGSSCGTPRKRTHHWTDENEQVVVHLMI